MKSESVNSEVNQFLYREKTTLIKQGKRNYFLWSFFSILIGLMNLTTVISSILIIYFLLSVPHETFLGTVGGSLSVAILTITLFILFFISAIYQTKMKRDIYKTACDQLQHETIQYIRQINGYKKESRKELYEKNINKISYYALSSKKQNISFLKIIKNSFVGNHVQ